MELFTLTEKKKSVGDKILAILFLVLAVISLALTLFSGAFIEGAGLIFFVIAVLFVLLWVLFQFRRNFEFELAYFDGDFKVVRIANKSRRKLKLRFTMDDVMQIAPAGDRSVYRYETDAAVKKLDFSSHKPESQPYVFIIHKGEATTMITAEPDDRMLDEICKKYRSKVVRK